tara:strand:- start:177 stop:737 length:561 start_codon:yes stop_codon:yes gene_type:complete
MAKKILGFIGKEEEEKKEEVALNLRGIDKEYQKMISALTAGEKTLTEEILLEKKIKRELVKLHKRINKIEKDVSKRNAWLANSQALQQNHPGKALRLIRKIEELDAELGPKIKVLSKDISKHNLQEFAEVYENIELSKEQITHIKTISDNLYVRLSTLVAPLNRAFQELGEMKRSIMFNNPGLKEA